MKEHIGLPEAKRAFKAVRMDWREMHDETYTWDVYFYDPNSEDVHGDPYPDRRFVVGPRGGTVVEHC